MLLAIFITSLFFIFLFFLGVSKKEKTSTKNYNISFGDSGVGGLIFTIDSYHEIISFLHNIELKYHIKFNLYHVGDSYNAPYGSNTPLEIKKLTNNFINYMVNNLNSQIAIVACNTASISFDAKYKKDIQNKFYKSKIIPIIKESVEKLYDEAVTVTNKFGKEEIHIGILATKATIKSNIYEEYLRKIHDKYNPNIELFIYHYWPNNWVENIENSTKINDCKEDVFKDLSKMLIKFPNIKNISVLGLFCTHFSFLLGNVEEFFKKNLENKNLKTVIQGDLFAESIKKQINKDLVSKNIQKRKKILTIKRSINIESIITGKNKKQMQFVIENMFPKMQSLIKIKKIPKIKEINLL